jgi:hypothetical protein
MNDISVYLDAGPPLIMPMNELFDISRGARFEYDRLHKSQRLHVGGVTLTIYDVDLRVATSLPQRREALNRLGR